MLNISTNKLKRAESKEQLTALKALQTPRAGKVLARWIIGFLVILFIAMFLPWQQNINGSGRITAFAPVDRPQTVQTAVAGRIKEWNVVEGMPVSRGDTLVRLVEIKHKFFDPLLLERLEEQVDAKESAIDAKGLKSEALGEQIEALESGFQFKLAQLRNKLDQARLKVQSDSADLAAERLNYEIARQQLERIQELYDKGLKSKTELEEKKLKFQETTAKLVAQENKLLVARNELLNARIELDGIEAEYQQKISKARSDLNATLSDVFESRAELSKLANEYANVQVRRQQLFVVAPQDGYVVEALKTGIGETLKEGEAVVTIVPRDPEMAAAIYIRPMDVPLISVGRKVRLEFEGWPALQFSGWPSVAVGTFGGIVAVIDYTESPKEEGKYRVLVVPDPEDEPWPDLLRMGSGVYGWIILDEVPVWYEIWRQLNGFPPNLKEAPATDYTDKPVEK